MLGEDLVVVVRRLFVLHCRPSLTSLSSLLSLSWSSSSAGHLSCGGLVSVIILWRPRLCRHPVEASSLLLSGRGLVIRPRRRRRRYLVGLIVCPPLLSSLSLSATPHIIVVVVVRGPFVLRRLCHCHRPVGASSSIPCIIVVSRPPHRHCCCCCWRSSSAPHVIVVRGSFVLWRPRPRHCLVGASLSLPHIVAIVVHLGLRCPSPTIVVIVVVWWGPHCLSPTSSSSSSAGHLSCRGLVAVVIRWGCLLIGPR